MTAGSSKSRSFFRLAVAFIAVAAGAFLLGRQTATPGRTGTPAGGERRGEGPNTEAAGEPGEGKETGQRGEIKFEEESLKLAKLRIEPVGYAPLEGRLAVTGSVEPNLGGVVRVTPRVAGKVTLVSANVGDNVQGGQPLATLASTELAQSQAAYRQAGARVRVALENLQRQRRLAGLGQFGRPKVEEARAAAIVAQGEIDAAQTEAAAARNEVAEARSGKASLEGEAASAQAQVVTARSEITEAEGQVRSLAAALAQAQTAVKVAKSRFDRAEKLLKDQLVSKQDWEQAQADYQHSQSEVDAAEANIGQGKAKVEAARARLAAAQAGVRAAGGRVEQAQAKIDTAVAREAQAQSRLASARKRGEIAAQALAREEKVYHGGFLTNKEIVDAEAVWRQAEAEQRAAADNIRLLGAKPGSGNLLTVTAPISGRVTERLVSLGETVTPEKPLFTVINLNSVWVQLNVHQENLPSIRAGQPVTISSDAAPHHAFSGAVSYVGDQVDETTRTVKVRCVIQNPGNVLKPQTFVRGTIASRAESGRASHAVAVPRDAVQTLEGKTVVFVPGDREGVFRKRAVVTGETVGDRTLVFSGIKPGERIVTQGAFMVKAQAMKGELGDND